MGQLINLDFLNAEHATALDNLGPVQPVDHLRTERRKIGQGHGGFGLLGGWVQAQWMREFQGLIVMVRFAPQHREAGVDIYTLGGRLLGRAEVSCCRPSREEVAV